MPIFDYVCKDCKEEFELFLQPSEIDKKAVCPKCGSKNIQRVFSTFGIGSKSGSGSESQSSCPTGTCPF